MLLALVLILIGIIYYFLYQNSLYWKSRNVPGPKPTFIVGNIGPSIFMKKFMGEIFTEIYNEYKNLPFVGIFLASKPNLLIRDPELIKDITVKSFSNFQDNNIDINKETDPLFGRNPFVLKGNEWKHVRGQLTPAFSSGKIKSIFPLLDEVSKQLANFIKNRPKEKNTIQYEAKELCSRFTLNNVASCAFGLEAKCFENDKSAFRETAQKFLQPSTWSMMKIFLTLLIPKLEQIIPIKFTPSDAEEEITNIVKKTIKYREDNNIQRSDFLHIMNELRKTDKSFTILDVTAHASGFILDGFETSSTVMSFLLYELAANPKVQTKLRNEIQNTLKKTNNKLEYQDVQEMAYLDAALSESLRMHPPIQALSKLCTETYTFAPSGENSKPLTIEKGTGIILPIHGLQTDPEYFPDPHTFMPERFLDKENISNTSKYTYLPFGLGPRACLGQRFGILQIKCGIIHVLNSFEIEVNEKTQVPFKYDPINFLVAPIGGIWINFKELH